MSVDAKYRTFTNDYNVYPDYLKIREENTFEEEMKIINKMHSILEVEKVTDKKEDFSNFDENIRNIQESFPNKTYLEIKELIENRGLDSIKAEKNNSFKTTELKIEDLFYNNYNFPALEKVLLKNLKTNNDFSENGLIDLNGIFDFNQSSLIALFDSEYISEKNKKSFMIKIFNILKQNHLKKYLVDGYSRKDARKQKKALKKEIFEDHSYIEDKLRELGLSQFIKYFPEENHAYTIKQKTSKFIKSIFGFGKKR